LLEWFEVRSHVFTRGTPQYIEEHHYILKNSIFAHIENHIREFTVDWHDVQRDAPRCRPRRSRWFYGRENTMKRY
jgi:hypothetical protein